MYAFQIESSIEYTLKILLWKWMVPQLCLIINFFFQKNQQNKEMYVGLEQIWGELIMTWYL